MSWLLNRMFTNTAFYYKYTIYILYYVVCGGIITWVGCYLLMELNKLWLEI